MNKAENKSQNSIHYSVVIPAGGTGQRMMKNAGHENSPAAKQLLIVHGKTILEHSVSGFLADTDCQHIYIAVEDSEIETISAMFFDSRVNIIRGGKTRMQSVLAGLNALHNLIDDEAWVMVHDAARANLYASDIQKLKHTIQHEAYGGILATPAKDTLKLVTENSVTSTLPRKKIWHALTPQMFRLGKLYSAMNQAVLEGFGLSDEASALEFIGAKVALVAGRSDNIKLTYAEDLPVMQELINARLNSTSQESS